MRDAFSLGSVRGHARRLSAGWTATFRLLLGAQLAHAAGNAVVAVALANTLFFAVPIGEARWRIALYLLLTMVPFAFLAPVLGRLVDASRIGAKRVLVVSGALRVLCVLLLVPRLESWALFPLALIFLVLSRGYGVTRVAVVPDALPPDRTLVWANTWMAVVSSVGAALGALAAVGAVKVAGSGAAMLVAAALFVVVTACSIGLPKRTHTVPTPMLRSTRVRSVPPTIVSAGSAVTVLRGVVGFVTFYLAFVLKADYSTWVLAVVFVAAGVGGGLGSFVALWLRRWISTWVLASLMLVPVAVMCVFAFARFDVLTAVLLAGVVGLSSAASRLAFDSELQARAEPTTRGRLLMRYETVFQLTWVAGAMLSLPPIGAAGGRALLLAIVIAGCVVAGRAFVLAHEDESGQERKSGA